MSRYLPRDDEKIWDLPKNEGDKTHSHDKQIQKIESASTKTTRMKNKPVCNNFKQTLDSKDCCKEIIKVVQNLKKNISMLVLLRCWDK